MSAPVERTFLPRGLIAYWKMDDVTGAARINEITPGTLNFTQTGGVVQAAVTGKAFVYASEIEGSTMSLAITANTAVNLGSVFSHAGWYMVSDKTKSNYLLDYGDDATFGDIGSLLIEGNAGGGGGARRRRGCDGHSADCSNLIWLTSKLGVASHRCYL